MQSQFHHQRNDSVVCQYVPVITSQMCRWNNQTVKEEDAQFTPTQQLSSAAAKDKDSMPSIYTHRLFTGRVLLAYGIAFHVV